MPHPFGKRCPKVSKDGDSFGSSFLLGFFRTRTIDYKGDEVKTARHFPCENIRHALPVRLAGSLSRMSAHWVRSIISRTLIRSSKPLTDGSWDALLTLWWKTRTGLRSVQVWLIVVFVPWASWLFGVAKDEWVGDFEVFRLMMNLIPLNGFAHSLRGDVETLPMWSMMNPFFLQPHEKLLVSSEDVRCFFYTMSVPCSWRKYLAFNEVVPQECLPPRMQGQEVY